MNNRKLTEKQEKFCNYYLDCDGNASEAYRMAYDASKMQPETIWSNASRMLASNKVAARIDELKAQRAEASKISRDKVEKVLMDIVMMDPNDLYLVDPVTGKIKLRIDTCPVEALHCRFIEFYFHPLGNFFANVSGEMVLCDVPALRCGNYAPFIVRPYQ